MRKTWGVVGGLLCVLGLLAPGPTRSDALELGGARIDARGAALETEAITVGLRAIGRDGRLRGAQSGTPRRVGDEARIARGQGVTEWWRALAQGIEQGVTIAARPEGEGPLVLEMGVGDDVRVAQIDGDALALVAAHGGSARYEALVVRDARSHTVPSRLVAAGDHIRIEVDDAEARYPLVVDPLLYATEEARLVAPDTQNADLFGTSATISGDGLRALVGVPQDDTSAGADAGSARVFVRTGTTWTQEATLTVADAVAGDRLGMSVALDAAGDIALVGAPMDDTAAGTDAGSVRVFTRVGSTWSHTATLIAPSGAAATDELGNSVAIDGTGQRAILGSHFSDAAGVNSGCARVFLRTGSAWAQETVLLAAGLASGDRLGESVAIDANATRVIVGAPYDNTPRGNGAGSAHVYLRTGTAWAEEMALTAADGSTFEYFAQSVALDGTGTRALVGAWRDDGMLGSTDVGSGRVFLRTGTAWAPEATLLLESGQQESFGYSVSLSSDGSRAVLGAGAADAANVWIRVGTTWTFTLSLPYGSSTFPDRFGRSVALDGSGTRAIGGAAVDGQTVFGGGSARVFVLTAALPNGATCVASRADACLSGFCADDVCCNAACNEDCTGCTAALTGGANGTCANLSAAVAPVTMCRGRSGGPCDAEEFCTSTSVDCPTDLLEPASFVCNPAASLCDAVEHCTGTDPDCPSDAALPPGTECRASTGSCDPREVCDGVSLACPGDLLAASGVVCRAVAGACDVEERCTGGSAACPADVVTMGGVCRPALGPCDVAETCSGGAACPTDAFMPATTVCNGAIAGPCDAADVCTGSSAACPPTFVSAVVCRASMGSCDPAELCVGDTSVCPPDAREPAGASCRASTGACDPEETCDGTVSECPADVSSCTDTGPHDAGSLSDAATSDGGVPGDASSAGDASHAVDAASALPPASAGCACTVGATRTPGLGALAVAIGIALALVRSRRRTLALLALALFGVGTLPVDPRTEIERERDRVATSAAYQPHLDAIGARVGGARLDADGLRLGALHLGLSAIGRGTSRAPVQRAAPTIDGPEARIARAPGVVEWWRSLPSGLEQGVDVAARIAGRGPLVLEMALGDGVTADVRSGDDALLRDGSGAPIARYAALLVRDADGRRVPARLVAGATLRIEVDDADAAYPLVIDPVVYVVHVATMSAPDTIAGDRLGASVALSSDGTRAIAGAPGDVVSSAAVGSARVFVRTGSAWAQEATLLGAAGADGDLFGASVAMSADGARVIVGAPGDDTTGGTNAGSVRVFDRIGTTWTETTTLLAPDGAASDAFGTSVAISGDGTLALAGAPGHDTAAGADAGSGYAFLRTAAWAFQASLRPAAAAAGDGSGNAIAMTSDGARALVGATNDDVGARANAGSVTSWTHAGTTWTEEATLLASGGLANDAFGSSVAISASGARAAIGANLDDTAFGTNSGTVRIFDRAGAVWTEDASFLHGNAAGNFLGWSMAIAADGSFVLSGLPNAATMAASDSGRADFFAMTAGSWARDVTIAPSTAGLFESFGSAVAISADQHWALVGNDASTAGGTLSWYTLAPTLATGTACSDDAACTTGFCVDGSCCDTLCGSDSAGGDILTDCEACAAALTGVANGTCAALSTTAAPTVTCRDPFGACDAAEHCTAGNRTCPAASAPSAAGTPCRAVADACDVAESCDGASYQCPMDRAAATGTPCRPAAAGGCDTLEVCDGTSTACPADAFVPAGVVCRSMAGPCDVDDRCTGTSAACPADAMLAMGSFCRAAVGPCDANDTCDGVSAACPDAFMPATSVCNAALAGPCDVPDHCTGSTAECPPEFAVAVSCRASAGTCDIPELCVGDSPACPPDAFQSVGMSCRRSTDPSCDTAETCDGSGAACPADVTTCVMPDAGPGAPDAGTRDASTGADATLVVDAGGTTITPASCSCQVGARERTPLALVLGLALSVIVWMRRARRRAIAVVIAIATLGVPDGARLGPAQLVDGAMQLTVRGRPIALALDALGRQSAMQRMERTIAPASAGSGLRFARADGVTEWWREARDGLEQGVDLAARPAGEGPLVLAMRVVGGRAEDDGDAILLRDALGHPLARYAELEALDADGVRLPSRMHAVHGHIALEIDDAHARYPLVIDPLLYAVPETVLGGTDIEDGYGASAALDGAGARALVGYSGDASATAGSVRVIGRSGSSWAQEARIVPADAAAGDLFGLSVAISRDGTRAAIGAPGDDTTLPDTGSVRVFLRSAGGTWMPEATLVAAGAATNDDFGRSVALSADGSVLAVSAPGDATAAGAGAGSIRVFQRTGTTWTEAATLLAADATAGDQFGTGLGISGDGTRVIGGTSRHSMSGRTMVGSASVFFHGASWTLEMRLAAPTGVSFDYFGGSVAMSNDGSRAVIGAAGNGGSGHVWTRAGSAWSETAILAGGAGGHLAMSDDGTIVLGGGGGSSASMYVESGGAWLVHPALAGDPGGRGPHISGLAISGTGNRAAVGVDAEDVTGHVSFFSIVPGLPSGSACTTSDACLGSACVDGFCCSSTCGGGALDDCQACSAALTGMANGTCGALLAAVAPTVVCRAAATGCDAEERCVPGSSACPSDAVASAGTVCRAGAGCDAPETCDGSSAACPSDAPQPNGFVCRPAVSGCDVPEACNGVSFACPGDVAAPPGAVCRGVAGNCDVEEHCTGAPTCPADVVLALGTPCRPSAGPCDLAEVCSGSAGACPADGFAPALTVCDPTLGGPCDAADVCTGSTASCPPAFAVGVTCRAAAGTCDRPEICLGDTTTCPPDVREPAGMVCRSSTEACDPAESCDGTAVDCPLDVVSCVDTGVRDAGAGDASSSGSDASGPPVATAGCACRVGHADAAGRGGWLVLAIAVSALLRRHPTSRRRHAN